MDHLKLWSVLIVIAYLYVIYWTLVICIPFAFEKTYKRILNLDKKTLQILQEDRRYWLTLIRVIIIFLFSFLSLLIFSAKLPEKTKALYVIGGVVELILGEITLRYLLESKFRGKLVNLATPFLKAFSRLRIFPKTLSFLFKVSSLFRSSEEIRDELVAELLATLFPSSEIPIQERKLLKSVFEFQDTTVKEIMTPRIDVVAVRATDTIKDVIELSIKRGFSKFPVYQDTIDEVIGVVYIKDLLPYLLSGYLQKSVRDLVKKAYFVPENKKIDELLREMQVRKITIAIVLDEYGGLSGIVTLEDILEELVGEIQDEHSYEEPLYRVLGPGKFLFSGKVTLDTLKEILELDSTYDPFEEYDVDTLGGLVYAVLGDIPKEGQEFEINGIKFKVMELDGQRLEKVLVELKNISEGSKEG